MKLLLIILYLFCILNLQANHPLREQIRQITENADAHVGVALIIDGKDTLTVNNNERYPLMSVMKYHQALAVADYLGKHRLPLSTPVPIRKEDLRPNTYSPLRDRYPEGNISLPVSKLLVYTLQQSDNNACDILFDYIGGTAYVNQYIRHIGGESFAITATEDDMHHDLTRCYENWSTPLAVARLMDRLATDYLPLDTVYTHFIRQTLLTCQTGKARLPFPLQGTEARIGHKTGTSDQNTQGEWIGINDAGFILLPDGRRYTLAVLVKHSRLSFEATEKLIADISTVVFRALGSRLVRLQFSTRTANGHHIDPTENQKDGNAFHPVE